MMNYQGNRALDDEPPTDMARRVEKVLEGKKVRGATPWKRHKRRVTAKRRKLKANVGVPQ